jgi:hypothetical protein
VEKRSEEPTAPFRASPRIRARPRQRGARRHPAWYESRGKRLCVTVDVVTPARRDHASTADSQLPQGRHVRAPKTSTRTPPRRMGTRIARATCVGCDESSMASVNGLSRDFSVRGAGMRCRRDSPGGRPRGSPPGARSQPRSAVSAARKDHRSAVDGALKSPTSITLVSRARGQDGRAAPPRRRRSMVVAMHESRAAVRDVTHPWRRWRRSMVVAMHESRAAVRDVTHPAEVAPIAPNPPAAGGGRCNEE